MIRRFIARRSTAVGTLILAILVAAISVTYAATRVSVGEVSEGLTCQCGCGLTVANCNHPTCSFSVPLRTEIEGMLDRGMSRDAIIGFYRNKFGEKILSAPTTEGFNLLAWTMPFAAIVVGGGLIAIAFTRWRHAPGSKPAESSPSDAVAPFDDELRRRLERELKEQL
ncbi:MAG TPA: cytochrome c-type biogenesis protein CcmH [Candidatus Binataceae bacterium]|nr:cytochrome c-type biogenesis protein CcmH [Candidatus Binataceae bacterium]